MYKFQKIWMYMHLCCIVLVVSISQAKGERNAMHKVPSSYDRLKNCQILVFCAKWALFSNLLAYSEVALCKTDPYSKTGLIVNGTFHDRKCHDSTSVPPNCCSLLQFMSKEHELKEALL